jgi:hypothetical protein
MVSLNDLAQFAEDLRRRGLDATHDFLYGPHGCIEGLDVGDDFFPLWELGLPENADALERADFAAIKQRRHYDWTLGPPPKASSGVT